MKNLTIALDESLLHAARRLAAERATSVNAMIRAFLEEETARESQVREARQRILALCRSADVEVGARAWTRDELHER